MKKSTIVIICLLFLSFNIFSYTFSGSNNNRSGCADWQAADGDINTFWQLAENENEGYLIISGPEEKKEKLIITADIPEDSIIQLYVKGGKGLKSISSCVKEGPYNGEFEFNIKENTSTKITYIITYELAKHSFDEVMKRKDVSQEFEIVLQDNIWKINKFTYNNEPISFE